MAVLDKYADYDYVLTRLRQACVGTPVELQLVWAFEILVILMYLKLRELPSRSKLLGAPADNNYVDTFDTSKLSHAHAYLGIDREICGRLIKFRHLFVHKGYLEAQPYLTGILNCDAGLASLSIVTGIDFTITNTLL